MGELPATPAAPEPLPHPVVDAHCHMDLAMADEPVRALADAMSVAAAVGVTKVVQVGVDVVTSRWAVQAANSHPDVVGTVALHPNEAPRIHANGGDAALDDALAQIDELAADRRVRAIGETGLDFFRTGQDGREAQMRSFRAHIELAKKHQKALMIHDRDAHEEVVRILDEDGAPQTVVFHCFSGDEWLAGVCAQRGWYASFAGTVTYKNANNIRAGLAVMPDHLILTETDAPFLPPVPHRGQVNGSYLMPLTVRFMAQERGVEVADFAARTQANAFAVFGQW